MATIKSYTSREQGRKLAEILPLESADMCYRYYSGGMITGYADCILAKSFITGKNVIRENDLPCWSLAALLDTLPNEILTDDRFECHYQIDIRKYDGGDNTTLYQIAYGNNRGFSGSWHDMINTGEKESLIDACVAMIEKLNELNLL